MSLKNWTESGPSVDPATFCWSLVRNGLSGRWCIKIFFKKRWGRLNCTRSICKTWRTLCHGLGCISSSVVGDVKTDGIANAVVLFLKITSTKRQDSLPESVHTVLKNKGGHSTFNLDRIVKPLVLPHYCISIYVCTCQEITAPISQANYKEIGSGQDFLWLSVSINLKIQYDGQCFFSNCFLRQL